MHGSWTYKTPSHIYIYIYIYVPDRYRVYKLYSISMSDIHLSIWIGIQHIQLTKYPRPALSFNSVQISVVYPHTLWPIHQYSWWRHQMETFSALLAICAGNSPVPGEFGAQRLVPRSFDIFLICDRINGDLRRYRAHYDFSVMFPRCSTDMFYITPTTDNLTLT